MSARAALTATTRLAYWLSPACPTGAFAFSHGLEYAFDAGLIKTRDDFTCWLQAVLTQGSGWADVVLCSLAWRGENAETLRDFALSLASCAERYTETTQQGRAFGQAASQWGITPAVRDDMPLPLCVGKSAKDAAMDHQLTLSMYASSLLTNLVQAALRMGRFGQDDGVAITVALEPLVIDMAMKAATASLDDIMTSTVIADMAAIQHETLEIRIFAT